MPFRPVAGLLFAFVLMTPPALADTAVPKSGNAVFDRAVDLVDEHFYSEAALPAFHAAVGDYLAELARTKPAAFPGDAVETVLASLKASHTGRFMPDTVNYYELIDIFRFAVRQDLRRLFPGGEVAYDGIGIASQAIGGKRFITDVYDGSAADEADLKAGDELLSVDGAPFAEVGSFKGKAGQAVTIEVRRNDGATPLSVPVTVARIEPQEVFLEAISDSVRVIERDGQKIGVVRLWSYTSDRVTGILYEALATTLKDVDGLVLDLRSRWGGAPADAAETFVGGTADMTTRTRGRPLSYVNTRFRKPVVAIIDEGTRSGMELLAYSLKKNDIPLVGQPTAGAVLAGTGYLLPDDSFLLLAVADVTVDGMRIEANPVKPDIAVPFDVRYAAGADPQFEAAVVELSRRLGVGSVN